MWEELDFIGNVGLPKRGDKHLLSDKKLPSCLFVSFFNIIFKVCHLSFFKNVLMFIFMAAYVGETLWEILNLVFFAVNLVFFPIEYD